MGRLLHSIYAAAFIIISSHATAQQAARKRIDSINNLPNKVKIANAAVSIKNFEKNLKAADSLNYTEGVAAAYANLGLLYYYRGKYDLNTNYMLKAIRLYAELGKKQELSNVYGEYGYMLKRRDMQKALYYMRLGMKLAEKGRYAKVLMAIYDNYGVLKEMQNDIDSAVYYYNKALALKEVAKNEHDIAYSLNKIAAAKLLEGKHAEAKADFDRAYAIRLKIDDKIGIAENLNFYGYYYIAMGKKAEAVKAFNESLKISKERGYNMLVQENYQKLAELYEAGHDYKSALQNYKNHIVYKDSLYNLEMAAKKDELDVEYETEVKEKEILLQKAALAEKNLWLLGVGALLVISMLLGYMVYNRQKLKAVRLRKEAELKDALRVIETQNKLQEQRLSISRDLHDNIGSQLTFIISSLNNLTYALKEDRDWFKEKIVVIKNFTKDTITELRDTIWAMNKDEITFADLQARIANFIDNAKASSHGIQFEFIICPGLSGNTAFSSLKGINLYRVIQESINNALKHAEPDKIMVKIGKEGTNYAIAITDDGKGFNKENVLYNNGLLNMQKRINEIGGSFTLHTAEGSGTGIEIQVAA